MALEPQDKDTPEEAAHQTTPLVLAAEAVRARLVQTGYLFPVMAATAVTERPRQSLVPQLLAPQEEEQAVEARLADLAGLVAEVMVQIQVEETRPEHRILEAVGVGAMLAVDLWRRQAAPAS